MVYTDEQLDNQLPPNLFCLEMGIDQGEKEKKKIKDFVSKFCLDLPFISNPHMMGND